MQKINKAYEFRIYPNKQQEELINKHIGCCRFIYNLALETKIMAYRGRKHSLSRFDLQKQVKDLKNTEGFEWLKEVNAQSLQNTLKNLDSAYQKFFKKTGGFPKFKSKHKGKQSFQVPQRGKVVDGKLKLPKFKQPIKIVIHREMEGKMKSITVSKKPTGKYFASILCDLGKKEIKKPKPKKEDSIGLDLGIKHFAITSDGKKIKNPKYLRETEKRLKFAQRRYSKFKGKKYKEKVRKLHEKVKNQRKHFLHNLSKELVDENQTIAIEDLNVSGMLKNNRLSKSISDASWSSFKDMLIYKSDWYGKNVIKIGRFKPSSKTCSECGNVNEDMNLSVRNWICDSCGTDHDRDLNAAKNIRNFAFV